MGRRTMMVAPLLLCSGACALVYQTVWLREFRLVFGASTPATAAVLGVFMAGLGVGCALLGRRADRSPSPLRLYARLEGGIALVSALTPALVWAARHVYLATGGSESLGQTGAVVLRLVLSTLVLAVPTVLMGGTLPAAVRAVETEGDVGRRLLGVVYGANTLGAVTGACLSTFVLIEAFGSRTTLWLACLVNLALAVLASGVARQFASRPSLAEPAPTEVRPAEEELRPGDAPPPFVLVASATVGFVFMLLEMVWYRMLAPLLGGSTFTFGIILAVALLGIGLGGIAYGLRWRDRPATTNLFAATCALEAVAVLLPFALGDRIAVLALFLRSLEATGFWGLASGWLVVAGLVVFPVALLAGFQFPALVALLGRGKEGVGRQLGLAYAWNTGGAIVGSLAGGFGLLPLLSATGTWRLAGAMLVALAVAAAGLGLRRRRWAAAVPAGLALLAAATATATGPTAAWRHSGIGAGRVNRPEPTRNGLRRWAHDARRFVRWEADGVESSVALSAANGFAFLVNGKSDGNAIGDAGTQIMSGMLGALLVPAPRRALVIGLGTGSTAGWLGRVESIEQVDVVEIEPAIVDVARDCRDVNWDVLDNSKVRLVIGDAREVLMASSRQYDLVFSEPSNPYRAGIASLYTREFYESAARRLSERGVFLQWLQAYEVDSATVKTVLATLASVFPGVEVWQSQASDFILVGSRAPLVHDVALLRERISQEPMRTALGSVWRASTVEEVLARFQAGSDFTRRVAALEGVEVNSDDLNRVEFAFARNVGQTRLFQPAELHAAAAALGLAAPALRGAVDTQRVEFERALVHLAAGHTTSWAAPEPFRHRYAAGVAVFGGNYAAAHARWRKAPWQPEGALETAVVAALLAEAGDDGAVEFIDRLREFQPAEAEALVARLRWKQRKAPEVVEALKRAIQRYQENPWARMETMLKALQVVVRVAGSDAEAGREFFRLLDKPFAASALEAYRHLTRIDLARIVDPKGLCLEAFAPIEPNPLWSEAMLRQRAACYEGLGHPLAAPALSDFEEYLSAEPVRFASGLLEEHEDEAPPVAVPPPSRVPGIGAARRWPLAWP